MKAELKLLYSPDIPDLSTFFPDDETNFGFMLGLLIGASDEDSSELFTATVCTPDWLKNHYDKDEIIWGRHYILVFNYDYKKLVQRINKFLNTCNGETWLEVANKVGHIALWEFED